MIPTINLGREKVCKWREQTPSRGLSIECVPSRRSSEKLSDHIGISNPGNKIFEEFGIIGESVAMAMK
jgi:hypothetical protein